MRAPDASDFAITVGSYELLEGVGSDAVSELWIARSKQQPERVLRLVRLKPDALGDAESREAFLAFMRKAATRRSPLLLRILAVASEGDNVYAVLEHVEGVRLESLLSITLDAGERLPVGITLRILLDVISALEALRSPHGDLTPESIHITAGGITLLSPASLAVAACRAPRDGVLRRLAYKAPEQLAGQQIGGSARADVFALGAILYEALAGRPLVPGTNGDDIAAALSDALPPYMDDLPPQLAKVLQRALARDPAKRYAAPDELGQALEKAAPELVADRHHIASTFWKIAGNDVAARRFELESLLQGATEVALEEARRSSEFPPAQTEEKAADESGAAAAVASAEPAEAKPAEAKPDEAKPDEAKPDEAAEAAAEEAEAGTAAAEEHPDDTQQEAEDEEHPVAERDEPALAHQRSIPPERAAQTRRVVTGVVLAAAALLVLALLMRTGHRNQEPSVTTDTAATQASPPAKQLPPAPAPSATEPAAAPSATAPEAPASAPEPAPSAAAPEAQPEQAAQAAPPVHHHKTTRKHRVRAVAATPAPAKTAAPSTAPTATPAPVRHVASFGALPPVPAKPQPKPSSGGAPVQKAPF